MTKKKHFFRENRFCSVRSRRIRRAWKHLAFSLSGCEIRRRYFSADLYSAGTHLRLYDDRSGKLSWPYDAAEPCRCFPVFWQTRLRSCGGWLNAIIPLLIVPYYSVIGGWVIKYLFSYLTGSGQKLAEDGYFSSFISDGVSTEICFILFAFFTLAIIFAGVRNGIERVSKFMMPVLVILSVIITVYSVTRPGALKGVSYFLVPNIRNFSWMTVVTAMGQMFYSLSISMGILITFGSYMKKTSLSKNLQSM